MKKRFLPLLLVLFACGGAVARDEATEPSPVTSTPDPQPAASTSGVATANVPSIPSVPSVPTVLDSQTLRVDLAVYVDTTPSAVVHVTVRQADTDEELSDAQVIAGPVGRAIALPYEDSPYMAQPAYLGTIVDYGRSWELSVVRGSDHLKNVVVVGPSYPSVTVTRDAGDFIVDWVPSNEANVKTAVCAWGTPSRSTIALESRCAETVGRNDEGTARVTPPLLPQTWTTLDKMLTDVPIGARGGKASFHLHVVTAPL